MLKRRFMRSIVSVLLLVAMIVQGTWVLAGTTGTLSGSVVESGTKIAVPSAKVTVVSPSQQQSTTTDEHGAFSFISLAPDTYSISVEKEGFDPVSLAGINVFADQTQTLALAARRALKEIGRVTTRSSGGLVKPGTTSDIYSVNATQQETVKSIGGGANQFSALSAVASVPGVYVPTGGAGWGQTFYIRGSNYSQIGYEYDGVPINRAFDNYQSSALSNLGQQELQVYTGGSPAGASSQTVAGFLNQVIKSGTTPGFASLDLGIGGPAYDHSLQFEIGGATPNRNFSYYAGFQGYNQDYRYYNAFNGGGLADKSGILTGTYYSQTTTPFGLGVIPACVNGADPLAGSPPPGGSPGCYSFVPLGSDALASVLDRETVVNLHFGLPHKRDGGKDDIQVLWSTSALHSEYSNSINDYGGITAFQNAVGDPTATHTYLDGNIFPGGTTFGQSAVGLTSQTYYFPSSPQPRSTFADIPNNVRDGIWNDSSTIKLQYQHNMGSNAYLRGFVYSFYSDWLQGGPNTADYVYDWGAPSNFAASPDYELITHTRGGELQFADQINAKHLLQVTANYTTANVQRWNNSETWRTIISGSRARSTNYADAAGNCYDYTTGALDSCYNGTSAGTYTDPTRGGAAAPAGSAAALANASWIVTVPGERGTYNTVKPVFTSASLTDSFHPSSKLAIDGGLRLESFEYKLANGDTPENNFWFNAAANSLCYDPTTKLIVKNPFTPGSQPDPNPLLSVNCPVNAAGVQTVHPDGKDGHVLFSAGAGGTITNTVLSPRLGLTYTLSPDTVMRLSAGRYAEPSKTASTQYLNKSGRSAATFAAGAFFDYGFYTPIHDVKAQVSDNIDGSFEHRFHNTDVSVKLSPFYRYTKNQQSSIIIGGNFSSDFNDSDQRAYGLEFQINKGDPSRNGFAGQLAYTYTRARQTWLDQSNGVNRIDQLNNFIDAYNALTTGAPCYANTGDNTPDPSCGPTSIRNPYFGLKAQPHLVRNATYEPYPNEFPNDPSDPVTTALSPHVISGFVNYRHNKFAVTPTFTWNAGARYGDPVSITGLDPRFCTQNSADAGITAVSPATDPLKANYLTCGYTTATQNGYLAIPNPLTGTFDGVAQYRQPSQLNVNVQFAYDVNPRVKATLLLANVFNKCFGGTSTPWSSALAPSSAVCGYGPTNYVANFYNGTSAFDTAANGTVPLRANQYPYAPLVSNSLPFSAYFNVKFKL